MYMKWKWSQIGNSLFKRSIDSSVCFAEQFSECLLARVSFSPLTYCILKEFGQSLSKFTLTVHNSASQEQRQAIVSGSTFQRLSRQGFLNNPILTDEGESHVHKGSVQKCNKRDEFKNQY